MPSHSSEVTLPLVWSWLFLRTEQKVIESEEFLQRFESLGSSFQAQPGWGNYRFYAKCIQFRRRPSESERIVSDASEHVGF